VEVKIMKDSTKAQDTGTAWSRAARRGILVTLAIAAGAVSLGLAKPVQADNVVLYATSFEPPIFKVGDKLLGIDGWTTAIPTFLNPDAAIITAAAASNRKQSVEVWGGDLMQSIEFTAPFDAVGSYRRPIGYEIVARQSRVHYDADLLLETDQPLTPDDFFSMTIAVRSGDGKTLGEGGLSSDGVFEGYSFEDDPAPSLAKVVASAPIRLNQWYRISMLLDYVNRTTSYYVDGRLLGTANFPPAPVPPDSLLRIAIVVYAFPDGGERGGPGSQRANYTARFDNLRVRVNSAAR
jgi:hypothetical protein